MRFEISYHINKVKSTHVSGNEEIITEHTLHFAMKLAQ